MFLLITIKCLFASSNVLIYLPFFFYHQRERTVAKFREVYKIVTSIFFIKAKFNLFFYKKYKIALRRLVRFFIMQSPY